MEPRLRVREDGWVFEKFPSLRVKRDGVIFEELTGWFEKSSFMVREDGWVFEKTL